MSLDEMFPVELRYDRFRDRNKPNPWLWRDDSAIWPYTHEWIATPTFLYPIHSDDQISVRINPTIKEAQIIIDVEHAPAVACYSPEAMLALVDDVHQQTVRKSQSMRIHEGSLVFYFIVDDELSLVPPFREYGHYFMQLPKPIREILAPAFNRYGVR